MVHLTIDTPIHRKEHLVWHSIVKLNIQFLVSTYRVLFLWLWWCSGAKILSVLWDSDAVILNTSLETSSATGNLKGLKPQTDVIGWVSRELRQSGNLHMSDRACDTCIHDGYSGRRIGFVNC